jgi:hypothetical protein
VLRVGNEGPRDWLAGGRHWDETPSGGPALPQYSSSGNYLSAYRPQPRRILSSTLLGWLAAALAAASIYFGIVSPPSPDAHISPLVPIGAGVLGVLAGFKAGARRRRGSFLSLIMLTVVITSGAFSVLATGYPLLRQLGAAPSQLTAASVTGPVASAAPTAVSIPAPSVDSAPAASAAPAVVTPPAPVPATRSSMGQVLGTLSFVLRHSRGPDGLQSPMLGVTSAGGVFDPFSAAPTRILVWLPAGTVLQYTTSVDRRNYAMVLSDPADPSLVVRLNTIDGVLTYG